MAPRTRISFLAASFVSVSVHSSHRSAKLVVVAFSIMIFGSLILGLLTDFTVGMFERIPDLVK